MMFHGLLCHRDGDWHGGRKGFCLNVNKSLFGRIAEAYNGALGNMSNS